MTASISVPARAAGRVPADRLRRLRTAVPQGAARVGPQQAHLGHPRRHHRVHGPDRGQRRDHLWLVANIPGCGGLRPDLD